MKSLSSLAAASLVIPLFFSACGGTEEQAPPVSEGVLGEHGVFRFELGSGGAPVVGDNTFELRVTEAEGDAPVAGATLSVVAMMPAHGHGNGAECVIEERGEGVYDVRELVFTMPGAWEVTIEASAAGREDRAVFPIEVR